MYRIFATKQLMEKSGEQHRDVYITFVEMFKAFDSVEKSPLDGSREMRMSPKVHTAHQKSPRRHAAQS